MKSDKKQTLVIIGIALLILAGIMLYVVFSAPRVYKDSDITYSVATSAESIEVFYPLNLNTATAEELASIDGLSSSLAYSIIAYREEIGVYSDVSQIKNIKGISETVYFKVFPYLTV